MEDRQVATEQINQPGVVDNPLLSQNAQQFIFEEEQERATPEIPPDPMVALLLKEMQQLRQDFDTKVKYDASKERLIESLHRELQTYREGLHFRVLRPVFTDLISMYDDIGKLIDSMPKGSSDIIDRMIYNLTIFQETVEEILRRNGAESFTIQDSTFVPSRQRILRVIPTDNPALDKQVARRVRKGFMYEEVVLRSEMVETYKYTSASSEQ